MEEDHKNQVKREAHELSAETFNAYVEDPANKMVVVDFYAPWCHWCQLLEPTWKQVARDLAEKPYASGELTPPPHTTSRVWSCPASHAVWWWWVLLRQHCQHCVIIGFLVFVLQTPG